MVCGKEPTSPPYKGRKLKDDQPYCLPMVMSEEPKKTRGRQHALPLVQPWQYRNFMYFIKETELSPVVGDKNRRVVKSNPSQKSTKDSFPNSISPSYIRPSSSSIISTHRVKKESGSTGSPRLAATSPIRD